MASLLSYFALFSIVFAAFFTQHVNCAEIIITGPSDPQWVSKLVAVQTAGTTVTFRGGLYATSANLALTLNGAPGNPVIIQGFAGETVTFLQQNPAGRNAMEVNGNNFILRNFILNQGSIGLRLGTSAPISNAVIENIEILRTRSTALTCNQASEYFNVTIRGCYIHDICYGVTPQTSTGECMYLGGSPTCTGTCPNCVCTANSIFRSGLVENNLCVNTSLAAGGYGSGIQLKGGSTNNIIRNNVLKDVIGPGILTYGWDYSNVQNPGTNFIDGNVVWNSADEAIQTGQGFVITNNIIIGTAHFNGIKVQPNQNVPADVIIKHNTIFSALGGGIRMDGLSVGNGGFVVANNAIFTSGTAVGFRLSDTPSVVNSKVSFMKNGVFGTVGYNSFSTVNATFTLRAPTTELLNSAGNNFYPSASSYLIGSADPSTQFTVSNDFNCLSRTNPPTVGAYQYSTPTNPGWQITSAIKSCTGNVGFTTASVGGSTTASSGGSTTASSGGSTTASSGGSTTGAGQVTGAAQATGTSPANNSVVLSVNLFILFVAFVLLI